MKLKKIAALVITMGLGLLALILYVIFKPTPNQPWKKPLGIWAQYTFTPIGNDDAINTTLATRFQVNLQTQLPTDQYKKLIATFAELLTIYKTADWNKFMHYETERRGYISTSSESELKSTPIFNAPLASLPANYAHIFSNSPHWPPVGGREMLHAIWMASYADAGFWNGVALSSASINVFQTAYPITDQELESKMWNLSHLQMGHGEVKSYFSYPQDTPPCKYAMIYFVNSHPKPDPSWPTILCLRWTQSVNNWILECTGSFYTGTRSDHSNIVF